MVERANVRDFSARAILFSTATLFFKSLVEEMVFCQWLIRKSRSSSVMRLEDLREAFVMSNKLSNVDRKVASFFL